MSNINLDQELVKLVGFDKVASMASKGNVDCQFQLAMGLKNGVNVNQDIPMAVNLLKELVAKDHTESKYELALMYEK